VQDPAQEDFRVNRGTADRTVGISQPFPHESEIDAAVSGDDPRESDLLIGSNKTATRYVATVPSSSAFLLNAH
jgi:hypothetical protein